MADISTTKASRSSRLASGWTRSKSILQRQGALIALIALVLFGALRYTNFLSTYNLLTVVSYNTTFALIALGMTFVMMTGGIDLSVGSLAALCSVVAALASPYGLLAAIGAAALAGLIVGLFNGWVIAWLRIPPFLATLAMLLAARGMALVLAQDATVSVAATPDWAALRQAVLYGMPLPVFLLLVYAIGAVWGSLVGALLLGLVFNILNFENGYGLISLGVSWQSVIRGAFLLIVVLLQSRLARTRKV